MFTTPSMGQAAPLYPDITGSNTRSNSLKRDRVLSFSSGEKMTSGSTETCSEWNPVVWCGGGRGPRSCELGTCVCGGELLITRRAWHMWSFFLIKIGSVEQLTSLSFLPTDSRIPGWGHAWEDLIDWHEVESTRGSTASWVSGGKSIGI